MIHEESLREALLTLNRCRRAKAELTARITENEQWYRLRHWACMRPAAKKNMAEPASGWLFNAIANKHADAMDNFPSANILPRQEADREEAALLGRIVAAVLDRAEFEQVYSDVMEYKLKFGTGVYGVFWDGGAMGGLGEVSIRKVDLLGLYWDGGVTDLQDSRNVFYVTLADKQTLKERYPHWEDTGASGLTADRYLGEPADEDRAVVVDWYYKRPGPDGRVLLHYCKFTGTEVLFASENEPEFARRGWYDHGLYPFILDPMYRPEGTPCGFGLIDIGKSAQEYIDRGNQAVMQNLIANARPRFFIRSDGSVNEEEFADWSRDFVHVDGALGQDSVLPVQAGGLNPVYLTALMSKVDELKEVTGNRDVSTGGTAHGVTAASAIAAMQEAGSKLSRDNNRAAFRAFRRLVLMVIELIRQFYQVPRQFGLRSESGGMEFVSYSNARLRPEPREMFGMDLGARMPVFDVEVTAEKKNPYSRMSQNELALQFFGAGFFDPSLAGQALAALEMMDFDRKSFVMATIASNASAFAQASARRPAVPAMPGTEASAVKNARKKAADTASPT